MLERPPPWLQSLPSEWPKQSNLPPSEPSDEERDICLLTPVQPKPPIIPLDWYSSFTRLKCVTAWILRFIDNCRALRRNQVKAIHNYPCVSLQELVVAENYWISVSQEDHFKEEVCALASNKALPSKSCLLSLHPFLDSSGILQVRGTEQNCKLSYSNYIL